MKLLSKILFILSQEEKKGLILISFLMFFGMTLEILGLSTVFPFIISIVNPSELITIEIIKKLSVYLDVTNPENLTKTLLILLVFIYTIKTCFMVLLSYKQNQFISNLTANLSTKLYDLYLNQPLKFHNESKSSTLMKNIQIEVSYFKSFCMAFITIAIEFSIAISIFITLLFVESLGALSVGIYFLLLGTIYFRSIRPLISKWGNARIKFINKNSNVLLEGLTAIRELIMFDLVKFYTTSFKKLNDELARINTKNGTFQHLPRLFLELFAIIGIVVFILILLLRNPSETYIISTIGVFIAATFRLLPSINRILNASQSIKFYKPSIDLIFSEFSKNKLNKPQIFEQKYFTLESKLELRDLYFKYVKDNEEWILEKINLIINKGDFIGIKGTSGSGKSTLIDILVGLIQPDKGSIYVNEQKHQVFNKQWKKEIGYVSQNIVLIDSTIRNNVALSELDGDVDEIKLNKSIEQAGLSKFVMNLNDGLDTDVGEKGVKLSGGQKQRIGIARALYKEPKILFLDEATSSLDDKTEQKIMDSINKLKGKLTIIIVAHRLSTLLYCNSIYEVKNRKLKKVS